MKDIDKKEIQVFIQWLEDEYEATYHCDTNSVYNIGYRDALKDVLEYLGVMDD